MTALPRFFSIALLHKKPERRRLYPSHTAQSCDQRSTLCPSVSSVVQGFEIADDTGTQGLSSIMLALSQKKPIRISEELA